MNTLSELDQQLAQRYGSYASYPTAIDPVLIETYGDGPADEVDRLLDHFAQAGKCVLDLGCGAGFTLCRLAPSVKAIWGFDEDADLLAAARQRVASLGLTNATIILGNVAVATDVDPLPDQTFDVVFSRRGPDVNPALLAKLKPEAYVIQELYQDSPGLLEMFGRKSFMRDVGDNPHWLVEEYAWLGLTPVSLKEYYYESFFRDAEHLRAYLMQPTMFFSWPMPPLPYDESRDRPALDLYVRYNTTPKGIRLMQHRKIYLFRRAAVQYMPVAPTVRPNF
ncbi:MAG: class I SAM-dependent methyltransferase [Caldilineaceae bacterium]